MEAAVALLLNERGLTVFDTARVETTQLHAKERMTDDTEERTVSEARGGLTISAFEQRPVSHGCSLGSKQSTEPNLQPMQRSCRLRLFNLETALLHLHEMQQSTDTARSRCLIPEFVVHKPSIPITLVNIDAIVRKEQRSSMARHVKLG